MQLHGLPDKRGLPIFLISYIMEGQILKNMDKNTIRIRYLAIILEINLFTIQGTAQRTVKYN